jgi:hypothetical protein
LKYWETFEPSLYDGSPIAPIDLYKLTRLTSITRERARIQNRFRLFVASTEVRKRRGTLEDAEKEKAIADKPQCPSYTVYIDESGKTSSHLILGSLWFLSGGIDLLSLYNAVNRLKDEFNFKGEFHFKHVSKGEVGIYCRLIDVIVDRGSAISFKCISLPRYGIRSVTDALSELYYHLLLKGIEHEIRTGRAPLPRTLQVWKDSEEPGADRLLMATLADRMRQASTTLLDGGLHIDGFEAVPSGQNTFLQIADLFVSSINRVMSRTGDNRGHKDDVADYVIQRLGIDPTQRSNETVHDMAMHIEL